MSARNLWRKGSRRYVIAAKALEGKTKRQAYYEFLPSVEAQEKPFVFTYNPGAGASRRPKILSEQLVALRQEISRVYKELERDDSTLDDFDDDSADTDTEPLADDSSDDLEPPADPKPVAKGKEKLKSELDYFLRRVKEIRRFCIDRARMSDNLDSISMRPVQAAARLIPAGIPADVLLTAMAMHWPVEARRDAGISDFDFAREGSLTAHPDFVAVSRRVMSERGIDRGKFHELFGYALLLAEARQPIMLIGPAGTGKSHLAKQIASYLQVSYAEAPMNSGAQRGDLLGKHTAGGFISAEFPPIYESGGVFNFEEIDASDPGMLITLNNALAQDALYNTISGEKHDRSGNFIAFSTANTFGIGANREYVAREKLDAATIDRWRMGRIYLPLDETVESEILYGRI